MDFYSLWLYLQVVLGIGLVIFVHEAGHFVVARWCKVRVHVFSLGFGPRLFGWKRGHTEYKVSAVPLGGYVRMAGDESAMSGGNPEPWELGSKSVSQRFFIYSGGVIANVLFGLVVFPILFAVGMPSLDPVIGSVQSGSPAWHARLEVGSRVLSVNGESVYDLSQVDQEIAYNGDRGVELVVLPPESERPETLRLTPTYDEFLGAYSIGRVGPSPTAQLSIVVQEGGAASRAGLLDGDQFLGVEGEPPGLRPSEQLDRALRKERPFRARVQRGDVTLVSEIVPTPAKEGGYQRLGVVCPFRHLAGIRDSDLTRATGLEVDDRLVAIEGRELFSEGDLIEALLAAEGSIEWVVRRGDQELRLESPALAVDQLIALRRDLFVKPDEQSTMLVISPDSAAEEAGLRTGDTVLAIDGGAIDDYDQIRQASRDAAEADRTLLFQIARTVPDRSDPEVLEFEARTALWSPPDPGFGLLLRRYTFRVSGPGEAILLGTRACWKMLSDVGRTLRGIMRQEVSGKSVGGIITISVFAHQTAEAGWVKFFWFLCLLSMNLAFLNVLPIPLLDGGHLFFLLVEGVKGSPVSERILSYSQLVGLVLIVSIFVFVIYNDLTRFDFFN